MRISNLFLKKAQRGDTEAQYEVGYMCLRGGIGAPYNSKKALEWYLKAANNGHALAQNELGVIYALGNISIKADYGQAREWFLKAGGNKCGNAFGNLAWMYMKGIGFEVDYKKAIEYFTKGADLGDRECMMNLGWMYSQGLGVSRDDRKAREWYDKAAKISREDTSSHIRFMEEYKEVSLAAGWGIENLHKPISRKDAFEYLTKRAETGDAHSMIALGSLLGSIPYDDEDFNAVRQSVKHYDEWYERAAAMNEPSTFYELGRAHAASGAYDKAIEYYEKALAVSSRSGNTHDMSQALGSLGLLYEEERRDYDKAISYYEKVAALDPKYGNYDKRWAFNKIAAIYASRGNHDKAIECYEKGGIDPLTALSLGRLFEEGNIGKPDYSRAFKYYKIGAEAGEFSCMLSLARMYENGLGVPQDMDKAIEFYRKAVKGSAQARKALARLNVSVNPAAKKKTSSRKTAVEKKAPSNTGKKVSVHVAPSKKQDAKTPKQDSSPSTNNDMAMLADSASLIRPRIAIVAFDDKSEEGKALASAILNMMVTELYKTGAFTLLERERLEAVASEQRLGQSGLVDPSTAVKLGRIAGAQYIMTGAVTLYYYNEKASGLALPIIGTSAKAKTAYVVIDLRIIDVETSEIVYAYDQIGEATNKERKSIASYSKMAGGLLGLATRDAVGKHVSAMRGLNLEI
ncbi:MAG: SEL1-like repeat protein [Synergistaceae bacterium]|nr:SEL1-like repeat protein [Synergistaceae bacterium]